MTDDDSNSCTYLVFPVIAGKENANLKATNRKDSDANIWKWQKILSTLQQLSKETPRFSRQEAVC